MILGWRRLAQHFAYARIASKLDWIWGVRSTRKNRMVASIIRVSESVSRLQRSYKRVKYREHLIQCTICLE